MLFSFIPILIAFEALIVFVHLTIYASLAAAFDIASPWIDAAFIVLAFTFVSASALSRFRHGPLVDWYYRFSAYWFGLTFFLFWASVVFYAVLAFFYRNGVYVAPALAGGISFGGFFLLHLYGTWESRRLRITNVQVPLSGRPGFDKGFWKGKKIVFVSDFQLGNIYRSGFLARAVGKIAAAAPYAVFIGGDLYDGVACDESALVAPLRGLHAPGGVYFITGNHEYYMKDPERAFAAIRAAGITILADEKHVLGGGVDVVGVDYRSGQTRDGFERALSRAGIDRARTNILLKHEPNHLDVAETAGISLALSGHTHRGQMVPFNLFTRRIYKGFHYGLKQLGEMRVFTSSGAGTWGPPLRLGTRSEIVVLEFV